MVSCQVSELRVIVLAAALAMFGGPLTGCSSQHEPKVSDVVPQDQEEPHAQPAQAPASPSLLEPAMAEQAEVPKGDLPTFKLEPSQPVMGSLVNFYRPIRIALSPKPEEALVAEPEYHSEKPFYGAIKLGDGNDPVVTLVIDEADGQDPRIYIDRNNDEDLTNDGSGLWDRPTGTTLGLSNVEVQVDYSASTLPYTLNFYRFTTRLHDFVLYYRNSGREGEITSGNQKYRIAVLEENADGRFDDLDNCALIIDLNQDGKLVGQSDSAEFYKASEPFNIQGKVWEIASLSPDGTELTLRPSDAAVAMKRYLDPGCPAPTFTGTYLDGKHADLAQDAAGVKYVLLDFWASWCGPCRGEFPYLRRLHARYKDHGLKIIGINLDSDEGAAMRAAEENMLSYPHVFDGQGWKNAVAVLYRVHGIPQTYLLDQDLNILQKGLRGSTLESQLAKLLGPGDTEAVAALDAEMARRSEASAKTQELANAPAASEGANEPAPRPDVRKPTSEFNGITFDTVRTANFSPDKINGSDNESNQLKSGSVFLAKTSQGHFSKFMIQQYGYDLVVAWVTYNPSGKVLSQGENLKVGGTCTCDLDSGQQTEDDCDFWWEQVDETERYLVPRGGAQFAPGPRAEQ